MPARLNILVVAQDEPCPTRTRALLVSFTTPLTAHGVCSGRRERIPGATRVKYVEVFARELGDFVAVVDGDLSLLFLNDAGRGLAGLEPGAPLEGLGMSERLVGSLGEELRTAGVEAARRDGVYRTHGALARVDGRNVDVQLTLLLIPEDEGGSTRLGLILRDAEGVRLRERLAWLLKASSVVLYACKAEGDYGATFVSENLREKFGYEPRQFLEDSRFWADRIHPDDAARVFNDLRALFEHGHHSHEYRFLHADGTWRWVHDELTLKRDAGGRPVEMLGTWQDISERKETELLVRRQAEALSDLSTPLIPITDDILVMPLVGAIDAQRAEQVLGTLLDGIARRGARTAIIDITGVAVVDVQVASALVKMARAVRLLGASVVLTGIRPDVARTLVEIGAELTEITTRSTLQAGVVHAMRGSARGAM